MPSDEPKPLDYPEIQPYQARLILALVLSLALHLALLFLVQVRPAPRSASPTRILQVALEGRLAVIRQDTETDPSPVSPGTDAAESKPDLQAVVPDVEPGKPAAPAQPSIPANPSPLPALDIPLVDDPNYYTAKQLDVHPAAAWPISPVYPDTHGDAEGFVTLKLLIDDTGTVREISVVDAQPPGVFEESALAAFRAARFLPGQRNGRTVKSQILIKVTYEQVNRRKKKD
jgi:protein TonB